MLYEEIFIISGLQKINSNCIWRK